MIARAGARRAASAALAMLAAFCVSACDAGEKGQARPAKLAPVIIVTKTDIKYVGQDLSAPDPFVETDCDAVIAKVPSVLFAYDPKSFALAATIAPKLHDSCIDDAWPEPLRRCIVNATPDALAHDHACEKLVTDSLARKVANRLGVPRASLP